jgi:hypothetical protein
MFCPKCGAQLPDDAAFCMKCGTNIAAITKAGSAPASAAPSAPVSVILAPSGATSMKCPSCGAPISPKFGEMVINCEYCGTSVTLGNLGWKSIQKHTMLTLNFTDKDKVDTMITELMNAHGGLLHRHLHEDSTLEEMSLSMVPYWIVPVSARTTIVATDMASEAGQVATTAALMVLLGGAMRGGRRFITRLPSFSIGLLGGVVGFGRGDFSIPRAGGGGLAALWAPSQGSTQKSFDMANNYEFPVIALKALTEYQPKNYQFMLDDRTLFDASKIPKGVKILNGDIGEEAASYQAKTLVDQLQSESAHAKYHMIQQLHTEMDVAEAELLHAPIWFARYNHKGNKIVLVIDANSGSVINSIGLPSQSGYGF